VLPAAARVGEGPVWDEERSLLYWVDIVAGLLHTSDPATGSTSRLAVPTMLGAAVLRTGNDGFAAATTEGFAEISWDGTLTTRCPILRPGHRMNDAKCDPLGRLWAGSTEMGFQPGAGALHVLEADFSTRVVLDGLTLPNGMGWSPNSRTYYLADTIEREISAFDVDLDTLALSGRRLLHRFSPDGGMPDGLCVDAEGCLWVAIWGGARLERISPDGELLRSIEMPIQQPSSCAFGGPRLTSLYITSAREGLDLSPDATDGSVFVIDDLGVVGLTVALFAG